MTNPSLEDRFRDAINGKVDSYTEAFTKACECHELVSELHEMSRLVLLRSKGLLAYVAKEAEARK